MSVTVNNTLRAYGVYNTERPGVTNRGSRTSDKLDSAEISGAAKDFGAILQAVKNTPDLRTDKVANIKSQVELGNYNVSSSAIANKILSEFYKTHG